MVHIVLVITSFLLGKYINFQLRLCCNMNDLSWIILFSPIRNTKPSNDLVLFAEVQLNLLS